MAEKFVYVVVGSGMYHEDGKDRVFLSKKKADEFACWLRFGRGRVYVEKVGA